MMLATSDHIIMGTLDKPAQEKISEKSVTT
jgi:hypothetical protein